MKLRNWGFLVVAALGFPGARQSLAADYALDFSTFVGAGSLTAGSATALGPDGSVYLAGSSPMGFPGMSNPVLSTGGLFVARLSADGARLDWVARFGRQSTSEFSSASASISGLAVDSRGRAVICGSYNRGYEIPGLPLLSHEFGQTRGFIIRMESGGNRVEFGRTIEDVLRVHAVAVDESDAIVYAGVAAPGFEPTEGAWRNVDFNAADQGVVAGRLDPEGEPGPRAAVMSQSRVNPFLALGPGGDVYVLGVVRAGQWASSGAYLRSYPGVSYDHRGGYVVRLNPELTEPRMATYVSEATYYAPAGLAVDAAGAFYTGGTSNLGSCGPSQAELHLLKVSADGMERPYYRCLGGDGLFASPGSVAVSPDGEASIVASGGSALRSPALLVDSFQDFPFAGAYQGSLSGWVAVLDQKGEPRHASYFGGAAGVSTPLRHLRRADGALVLRGMSRSTEDRPFLTTPGAWMKDYTGHGSGGAGKAWVAALRPVSEEEQWREQDCALELSDAESHVNAWGGVADFAVLTRSSACRWPVRLHADWLRLQRTEGRGSGQVAVVAEVSDGRERTALVEVDGREHLVRQGGFPCSLRLPPLLERVGAEGGWLVAEIDAPPDCTWAVASLPPWLRAPVRRFTGPATLSIEAEPNPAREPRTAEVSLSGWPLRIRQEGARNHPPEITGFGPKSTALSEIAFTVTIRDPNGWKDIRRVWLTVGQAPGISGACNVTYDQTAPALMLPGRDWRRVEYNSGELSDDWCSVHPGRSDFNGSGDTLRIVIQVRLRDLLRDSRVFVRVQDRALVTTEWSEVGRIGSEDK
ncbi:MAG: hypothetical protein M9913_09475 [Bryobacteraceae bacterium]|nr:BACON domain-containing protein [Solibacteraceae bacterium]MCO5351113.1 hypothetical protein [Bryobacteraceae bacterium]